MGDRSKGRFLNVEAIGEEFAFGGKHLRSSFGHCVLKHLLMHFRDMGW